MAMKKFTDDTMEEIAQLHVERGGTMTWRQIINELGLTGESPNALRKSIARYERRKYGDTRVQSQMTQGDYREHVRSKLDKLKHERPSVDAAGEPITYFQNVDKTLGEYEEIKDTVDQVDVSGDYEKYALTMEIKRLRRQLADAQPLIDDDELIYYEYPRHLDDRPQWRDIRERLLSENEWSSFMFMSDFHIPDHNRDAVALATNIFGYLKPHVLFYGGDVFDLDAIGRYGQERFRRSRDAIREVRRKWYNIVTEHTKRSPETVKVAFKGNHEARLDDWNTMEGIPFADTIEEAFVETVRADGQVLWLAEDQETKFGGAVIQHGKRHGKYAAKSAVENESGGSETNVQGHAHRPTAWWKRVHKVEDQERRDYRVVTSVVSGTLSNIPPHYVRDSKSSSWLQGVVVGHVHQDMVTVNLQPIIFHRRSDGVLWAAMGDLVFTSEDEIYKM